MLAGCPPSQIEEYSCRAMNVPSLVMKEMNSLTHSCIHSLASLAILALSGSAPFIIRATGAKLRMLASEATSFLVFRGRSGCDRAGSRDAEDMTVRQSARCQKSKLQIWAGRSSSDSTVKMSKRAIGLYMGDGKAAPSTALVNVQVVVQREYRPSKLPCRLHPVRPELKENIQNIPFAMGNHRSCSLTSKS